MCPFRAATVSAALAAALALTTACPADPMSTSESTTSDANSSSDDSTTSVRGSDDAADSTAGLASTDAGEVDSDTGPAMARWCDQAVPTPAACADFDGPAIGWVEPRPEAGIEAVEDGAIAASPPNSLRYTFATEATGTDSVSARHVWSSPVDPAPGHLRGFFRLYFADGCDTPPLGLLELAVGDGSGDLLELWLEVGPDRVIVWSSEPDDFQQPWYDEPTLPIAEWIELELDINLVDRSARLRIGDDSAPFPTLWDTTPGFEVTEAHARFGPSVFTGFTSACTFHVDDVAVLLQ